MKFLKLFIKHILILTISLAIFAVVVALQATGFSTSTAQVTLLGFMVYGYFGLRWMLVSALLLSHLALRADAKQQEEKK